MDASRAVIVGALCADDPQVVRWGLDALLAREDDQKVIILHVLRSGRKLFDLLKLARAGWENEIQYLEDVLESRSKIGGVN